MPGARLRVADAIASPAVPALRPLTTLLLCLGLLLAGCGGGSDSSTGATTASADVETARVPLAAVVDPAGAKGLTLTVSRVTVAAGDMLDPHYHEGTQAAYIDSGILTYSVIEGEVPVMSGPPEEDPELVREIKAGQSAELEPGQWVVEQQSDVHMAENRGDVPVEITLTSLLEDGAEASTPAG